MTDVAVFADGPLKGTTMAVPPWSRGQGMHYRPGAGAGQACGPLAGDVLYRFSDVPMLSRTVLVGSVAQPPDSEACFELLCSDLAKESARFPETGRKG